MHHIHTLPMRRTLILMFFGVTLMLAHQAVAEAIPANIQAKVDNYKKKLESWAADPVIVAAVKESNAKGGIPGMNNGKWESLAENDPQVLAILGTPASKKVDKWEEDKGINKLLVRDAKGNLVAGSSKPLLYNVATRPPFKAAIEGVTWQANEIKPDPTSQVKSVQIAAPIKDGGSVIGVIHSAVTAE